MKRIEIRLCGFQFSSNNNLPSVPFEIKYYDTLSCRSVVYNCRIWCCCLNRTWKLSHYRVLLPYNKIHNQFTSINSYSSTCRKWYKKFKIIGAVNAWSGISNLSEKLRRIGTLRRGELVLAPSLRGKWGLFFPFFVNFLRFKSWKPTPGLIYAVVKLLKEGSSRVQFVRLSAAKKRNSNSALLPWPPRGVTFESSIQILNLRC